MPQFFTRHKGTNPHLPPYALAIGWQRFRLRVKRLREARERLLDHMYDLAIATGPRFFQRGRHYQNADALNLTYWSYRDYLQLLMRKYPHLSKLRKQGLQLPYLMSPYGTWHTPMIPARIRRAEHAKKRQHLQVK